MKKSVIVILLLVSILIIGCVDQSSEDTDETIETPVIKQAELTNREKTLVSAVGTFREVRVFSLENIDDYEWIETYIDVYDNEGLKPLTSTGSLVNKDAEDSFITFSITELNERDESFWNVAFIQDEGVSKYNMPIKEPFRKSTTISVVTEKEYVEGEKNIFAYMIVTDNNEILAPTVDSLESYKELDVDENTINYIFSYQLFKERRIIQN